MESNPIVALRNWLSVNQQLHLYLHDQASVSELVLLKKLVCKTSANRTNSKENEPKNKMNGNPIPTKTYSNSSHK